MKRFIALILAIVFLEGLQAQNPENPFELRFRETGAATAAAAQAQDLPLDPGNPFELRVRPAAGTAPVVAQKPARQKTSVLKRLAEKKPLNPAAEFLQIKLWVTIGLLVTLTILLTLFRHASARAFTGFINDNLFFQAYREQEGRGSLPFLMLYALFPVNVGSFAFFGLQHYDISFLPSLWAQLGACIGIVFVLILLKHLVLALIAYLFPVEQELNRYNFLIVVFGIVLGLLLIPVNILLAFGPGEYHQVLLYGGAIALAAGYLFRFLRGVLIANKFLLFHQFHFLLYICTVEIAPVLNFVKLLTGWNEI